jgi:endonuclease/exonuclease/phosphatase family metal-dependent hydrolase
MRIESFQKLKELISGHSFPSVALGDFNVNNKDDKKFNIYQSQEDFWKVAHIEGCSSCLGTYYYGRGKSWDFLDTIMVSRDRGVEFEKGSIDVFKIKPNIYKDTGKPKWFDSETRQGVSDHFPIVAEITLK